MDKWTKSKSNKPTGFKFLDEDDIKDIVEESKTSSNVCYTNKEKK